MVLFVIRNHLDMIPLGLKTETRRLEAKGRRTMYPGKTYPAIERLFIRKSDAIIIKCVDWWLEPVRDISKQSALNEGLYTPAMFKRLWKSSFGDLETPVSCYKFEFVEDRRPCNNRWKRIFRKLKNG